MFKTEFQGLRWLDGGVSNAVAYISWKFLAVCLSEPFVNFRKAAQHYIPKDVFESDFFVGLFASFFFGVLTKRFGAETQHTWKTRKKFVHT
jgi:hypothetical protein